MNEDDRVMYLVIASIVIFTITCIILLAFDGCVLP